VPGEALRASPASGPFTSLRSTKGNFELRASDTGSSLDGTENTAVSPRRGDNFYDSINRGKRQSSIRKSECYFGARSALGTDYRRERQVEWG